MKILLPSFENWHKFERRRFGPIITRLRKVIVNISVCCLTVSCAPFVSKPRGSIGHQTALEIYDSVRTRNIPVTIYGERHGRPRPLAVILPGYGIGNGEYSFIARELVTKGYVVAAIQVQLTSDPPVPGGDNLQARRRPFWHRGVADVRYVASVLRERRLANVTPLVLVGHSHGGDIVMLYATEHPREVQIAFSLDNRRMPLPLSRQPRICSARSSDQLADPAVLPSEAQQGIFHMRIKSLPQVRHDDMLDAATDGQKLAMIAVLRECLSGGQAWQAR